jgi:hypothetical protein
MYFWASKNLYKTTTTNITTAPRHLTSKYIFKTEIVLKILKGIIKEHQLMSAIKCPVQSLRNETCK